MEINNHFKKENLQIFVDVIGKKYSLKNYPKAATLELYQISGGGGY